MANDPERIGLLVSGAYRVISGILFFLLRERLGGGLEWIESVQPNRAGPDHESCVGRNPFAYRPKIHACYFRQGVPRAKNFIHFQ
jgi:hypothetical protein